MPDSLGTQFVQDPGEQVSIAIGSTDPVAKSASDPDIFYDGTQYVMLVSRGTNTQVFTSSSLAGTYAPVSGLSNSVLVWECGVVSGHYDSASSQYWIYVIDSFRFLLSGKQSHQHLEVPFITLTLQLLFMVERSEKIQRITLWRVQDLLKITREYVKYYKNSE